MEPASSTSPDAERVPSGSSGSLEHPDTAERVEPVGRPGAVDSIDRLLLVGGTLLLVGLHLRASWPITGPSIIYDESGYLGTARFLARDSVWQMPLSPFYAVGYSVLLAPIMLLFDTAEAQWRAILTLNTLLVASVFPLLAAVLRRLLNLPMRRAMVAAAPGALAPAGLAAGISARAESLTFPLILVMVLAAWAAVDDRAGAFAGSTAASRLGRYAFGPAVAALYLTHSRFVGTFAVAVLALAIGGLARVISARVAAVNGALLVVMTLAGRLLNQRVRQARWDRTREPGGELSDWIELVTTTDGLEELYLTATGQAWYLAVGSAGVAVVGVAVLIRGTLGRTREEAGLSAARARRLVCGFVLAGAGALFATSVVFFAQNQFRPDHWIYGRHNDSFMPLWLGLGMAALLGASPVRRRLGALAVGAAVIAVSGAIVTSTRDPATLTTGFSALDVPAVIRYRVGDPSATFRQGTAVSLVATAVVAALVAMLASAQPEHGAPRGRRILGLAAIVLPMAAASWFGYHGHGAVEAIQSYQKRVGDGWTTPEEIRRLGITELDIEAQTARSMPTLTYPFALPGVDVRVYQETRNEEPEGPYVLARLDDPARAEAGDRAALLDERGFYRARDAPVGLAVWVRPGPEQDRLAEAGLLLPEGFPTELPDEAQQAELAVIDGLDDPVRVSSGESVELTVTGRHAGTGSPWPDRASFALEGRVRIIARVTPLDPGGTLGAVSGGELPRWIRPGESFTTEVRVFAVGTFLEPLPTGRYQVELGLGQEGEGWFASGGDDATFTMEVVPAR